jgi:hypothetical protein
VNVFYVRWWKAWIGQYQADRSATLFTSHISEG